MLRSACGGTALCPERHCINGAHRDSSTRPCAYSGAFRRATLNAGRRRPIEGTRACPFPAGLWWRANFRIPTPFAGGHGHCFEWPRIRVQVRVDAPCPCKAMGIPPSPLCSARGATNSSLDSGGVAHENDPIRPFLLPSSELFFRGGAVASPFAVAHVHSFVFPVATGEEEAGVGRRMKKGGTVPLWPRNEGGRLSTEILRLRKGSRAGAGVKPAD